MAECHLTTLFRLSGDDIFPAARYLDLKLTTLFWIKTCAEREFRFGWITITYYYNHYFTGPLGKLMYHVKVPVLTSLSTPQLGFQINIIKRVAGTSWVHETGPGTKTDLQLTSELLSFPCHNLANIFSRVSNYLS